MNKTNIEWCDYTINPIKGLCKTACPYCYARRMYVRYRWDPKVRYEPMVLRELTRIKKPSRVFVCSTHDILGEWIPDHWIQDIIMATQLSPWHTYIFLTKNSARYRSFPWPENCLLGATITGPEDLPRLKDLSDVGMKGPAIFASFEPLLKEISAADFLPPSPGSHARFLQWTIIGGLSPKLVHDPSWIDSLVAHFAALNIPVFIKDNAHYHTSMRNYPRAR
jgi:protein gp37